VENNGTCDWDKNYKLQLIEGDALGAETNRIFSRRAAEHRLKSSSALSLQNKKAAIYLLEGS
jgi:hypothetical protein